MGKTPPYSPSYLEAQPQMAHPQMEQHTGQHTVVMAQPAPANVMFQTVIVQQPIVRPPNYMWLSCVVFWLCNWLVGGFEFALSSVSSPVTDEDRMEEGRNCGKAAMLFSIAGAVLGIITIVVTIGDIVNKNEDYYYE